MDDSDNRTFSFEQANAICRGFAPIGNTLFELTKEIQRQEFSAFVPRMEFAESFCSRSDDVELHRQCLIEFTKMLLGRPFPFALSETKRRQVLTSPLLDRLRQKREKQAGVPVHWIHEIDPCERRIAWARVNDRMSYTQKEGAMLQRVRKQLDVEATIHSTDLHRGYRFDERSQCLDFFSAVMTRDASLLGFGKDRYKSNRQYPVFSKPIAGDWDLCWVIEQRRSFYPNSHSGLFLPELQIRHRSRKGSVAGAKRRGEFLTIRHSQVILGFPQTYGEYLDLTDLETMIKAHLCLYTMLAPTIEGALKDVLGHSV